MSFITLKEKIRTILLTIPQVKQILDYPSQDFNGYPCVVVRTNGNTSEYETTHDNEEVYSFSLFLFQNLDEAVFSKVQSREIVEELCDTIRDTFDSDEFLNGVSMPSGRTLLGVRPTVSQIGEDDSGPLS